MLNVRKTCAATACLFVSTLLFLHFLAAVMHPREVGGEGGVVEEVPEHHLLHLKSWMQIWMHTSRYDG